MVIGKGTNILVSDNGYPGVMVMIGEAFSSIEINDKEITAEAGASIAAVARAAMESGLTGLEFASGIPGSVGGAVFMNAGAYDMEMKDVISNVNVVSRDGLEESTLNSHDMKFSYRYSSLQDNKAVVIKAVFKLEHGNIDEIREKTRKYTELRNKNQPVSMASAGSFFKRPTGHFAGKLIEDAGLKGLAIGGAMVSPVHAGFIVNTGSATATEIIDLMQLVRHTVLDKYGVELEPEVRIIGDF
jgi:UDP-N-acetylmuramate dehydrogenase